MKQENLIAEVVATESINAEMMSAEDILGLGDSPYSGTILREVWKDNMDNVASNLSQKDVRLVDIYHEMDGESLSGFLGMIYGATDMIMSDGRTLSEHVRHIEGQAFNQLEELTSDICTLRGTEANGGKLEIAEAAQALTHNRLLKKSYWGGRSEEVAGHSLVQKANAEDFAVHSDRITDMLGIDNPEAREIDMLVLWEDGTSSTAQVKYGPGGQMPDTCEADILIRYEEPNEDNTLINPVVRVYDIPTEE